MSASWLSPGDFMSILEIAQVLKRRMGAAAARVPTKEIPRLAGPDGRHARSCGGANRCRNSAKSKNATNEKARRVLGWAPRSNEEAIVATAESLLQLKLLKEAA